MKRTTRMAITMVGFAACTIGPSVAQDVAVGRQEFIANCAVCHGETGKGDGPFAEFLKTEIPDLTSLAINNNGQFPSDSVYQIIDGRQEVAGHGPRNMPIWGLEYNAESTDYYREVWKIQNAPAFVRSRIESLVAYITTLQQ